MATLISPRVLRRGLEIFAGVSVLAFGGLLLYGNNLEIFLSTMTSLKWGWLLVGLALASMDWFGGGLRLWILTRHVHPAASLKVSILAGGLTAWASYLTPSQTGGGPMMIYTLKRYGTPIPEAMISSLMTFVATVIFFAIALRVRSARQTRYTARSTKEIQHVHQNRPSIPWYVVIHV